MLRRKNTFMIMAIGLSALFAMSCQKSSQESGTTDTATADKMQRPLQRTH